MTESWCGPDGVILHNVHDGESCLGGCPLHGPSFHHMRTWKLRWDASDRVFWRVCPHGLHHPDPDSIRHLRTTSHGSYEHVRRSHRTSCDGCCDTHAS